MGRDRLYGRWADGRGICKKNKTPKNWEKKAQGFSLGCDTDSDPKSPSSANEEADDEGLDVSKNVSWSPQEKAINTVSFIPISHLNKYIQQEEEKDGRGWEQEHWKKGGNQQREQVGDSGAF